MRKLCSFICYFIGSVVKIVLSEAAIRGVLHQKVFLKSLQNSQGNTCATVSFLINLQALLAPLLIVLA